MKIIFWSLLLCNLVFAQSLQIPYHNEILDKTLKDFQPDLSKSNEMYSVSSVKIGVKEAPFLRVFFDDCNLGNNSYIKMTSFYDGYTQILNTEKLQRWKNSSMIFNGDTLLVELYESEFDNNINIRFDYLLVGEKNNNQSSGNQGNIKSPDEIQTICGSDDRVPSDNKAIGRIFPIMCTAWIAPSGQLVTAGHCVESSVNFTDEIIEFNVPLSKSDGSVQHPGEEDQYLVSEYNYNITKDWAVFNTNVNTETGLYPIEGQEAYLGIEKVTSLEKGRKTKKYTNRNIDIIARFK